MQRIPFLFSTLLMASLSLLYSCGGGNNDPSPPNLPPNTVDKTIRLIQENFEGISIVVVGSEGQNLLISFIAQDSNGNPISFEPLTGQLPNIMEDGSGNRYDIFGRVTEGPNEGFRLASTHGVTGYWFAFSPFLEQLSIYGGDAGETHSPTQGSNGWLIPHNEVFVSTSKDGIPSIDNPKFVAYNPSPDNPNDPDPLEEDELVIGVMINGEFRLYPHQILDWHEIVNDEIDGVPFSLIYCPLTGTASAWLRKINGQTTTFGVSGMLYNSNIVPYDRLTESIWSQLYEGSVLGEVAGEQLPQLQVVETTWSNWKLMFRSPQVLSFETGFSKDYGQYPYGDYKTNHQFLPFPLSRIDDRIPSKERVHVVRIGSKGRAYRFGSF